MNTRAYVHIIIGGVLLLLSACSQRPTDVRQVAQQPDIFPDYVGVTIPVGMAPLDFAMADDDFTCIDVEVRGTNGGSLHANGSYADFDVEAWHELVARNKGYQLVFTVTARRQDGQWLQYQNFNISVSTEPMNDWGVTYRLIPPSYVTYSRMGIYERELSSFRERALMVSTQSKNMCLNCHTPNHTNPEQYVFHVRGPHGATIISRAGQTEVLEARNDSLGGSMVYASWHPGGRYCAFSTNKTAQIFHMNQTKRIEVFDSSSDVFVYDTEKHELLSDSLTMTSEWAENCPAFSADGKWLYFVTARQQDYPEHYKEERYSLCRISFDAASRRYGEKVDTLISSELTGKSVTWPQPSDDGRYLIYTQTDYGYFSVWHPEADLWLLDLSTGERRPMDEVNSPQAESLHHWSRDSRWFLFTSRRDDGLYTRLYFSCLQPDGRATKPFLLPQRNPKEYYRELLYSYNTPDFTLRPVSLDARRIAADIERNDRTAFTIKEQMTTIHHKEK